MLSKESHQLKPTGSPSRGTCLGAQNEQHGGIRSAYEEVACIQELQSEIGFEDFTVRPMMVI